MYFKKDSTIPHPKYDNVDEDGMLEHIYGHKICLVTQFREFVRLDELGEAKILKPKF